MREIRLSRGLAAVTALRRGDVDDDRPRPARSGRLAGRGTRDPGRAVRAAGRPPHRDGRPHTRRSATGAFRRGLSYAIDRKGLLEETVLKHPINDVDALADGPFPKGSYADATGVKPLGFDILLAKMLVAAAHKELGGRRSG